MIAMSSTTNPTISNTMSVTSTSTPAINGTYSIGGPLESAGLQGEINAVSLNGTFADGTESLNWPDVSHASHTFTVAQFKTFAAAIALYRAQWAQFANGLITTAPSSTATIP